MKMIYSGLLVFATVFSMAIGIAAFSAPAANAVNVHKEGDKKSAAVNDGGGDSSVQSLARNIISAILFALGMIAVVMIVIGGFRYVTSNGDSGAIQSAKNTILYAVIGLIVAILSFAIVNFVLDRF